MKIVGNELNCYIFGGKLFEKNWIYLHIYFTLLAVMASVSYASANVSGDGLYAEYYNNMSLSGTPTVTRIDPTVNFNWGNGSPDSQIQSDQFSALDR